VRNGKPVERGARIIERAMISYLSEGDSTDEVLNAHPNLSREDVLACFGYARVVETKSEDCGLESGVESREHRSETPGRLKDRSQADKPFCFALSSRPHFRLIPISFKMR